MNWDNIKPGLHPLPAGTRFFQPYVLLATWFGSGLLKPASGTMGTIAAIPFAYVIFDIGGAWLLLIATIIALIVGTKVADKYNKANGDHDNNAIVIDEVAGVWLALIPAANDPRLYAAAFLLFRIFDIYKPWPASRYERKTDGGWPVMMDDIWAGIYAFLGVASMAFFMRIKG